MRVHERYISVVMTVDFGANGVEPSVSFQHAFTEERPRGQAVEEQLVRRTDGTEMFLLNDGEPYRDFVTFAVPVVIATTGEPDDTEPQEDD